jgi:hypothetical protein
MIVRCLICWLLLLSSVIGAELTVFPSEGGQSAAMCISDTPGRWAIWKLSEGPVVDGVQIIEAKDDRSICVFSGAAGTYFFQLVPNDVTQPFAYAKAVLGESPDPEPDPDPNPDPDPEPRPPPGPRKVTVIHESEDRTPSFERETEALQVYCRSKGHTYLKIDDDAKSAETKRTPGWLQESLDLLNEKNIAVPAIVVEANNAGKRYRWVRSMPQEGESIRFLQSIGG